MSVFKKSELLLLAMNFLSLMGNLALPGNAIFLVIFPNFIKNLELSSIFFFLVELIFYVFVEVSYKEMHCSIEGILGHVSEEKKFTLGVLPFPFSLFSLSHLLVLSLL